MLLKFDIVKRVSANSLASLSFYPMVFMVNCYSSFYPLELIPQALYPPAALNKRYAWKEIEEYCHNNNLSLTPEDTRLFSPLAYAAYMGGPEWLLKSLIDQGALINDKETGIYPPIFTAILGNHPETVKTLISLKADLNYRLDGLTPLHLAAKQDNGEMCEILINAGIPVDSLRDKMDKFSCLELFPLNEIAIPLGVAVQYKALAAAKVLLQRGVDPALLHDAAFSPVGLAFQKLYPEMIEMLVKQIRDVNTVTIQGLPFLHFLFLRGYEKYFNQLIQRENVKLDLQDINGMTLLHLAVKDRNEPLVNFLIKRKVNLDKQTIYNERLHQTPLHLAIIYEFEEIAKLLLEAGAKVQVINYEGDTPYMCLLLSDVFSDSFKQHLHEKDDGYSDQLIKLRLFGLRFGLAGLLFEGASGKMTIAEVVPSFLSYMEKEAAPAFKENFELIKDNLFNSDPKDPHYVKDLMAKIEKGQPVFLYLEIPTHFLTCVIWKNFFLNATVLKCLIILQALPFMKSQKKGRNRKSHYTIYRKKSL